MKHSNRLVSVSERDISVKNNHFFGEFLRVSEMSDQVSLSCFSQGAMTLQLQITMQIWPTLNTLIIVIILWNVI